MKHQDTRPRGTTVRAGAVSFSLGLLLSGVVLLSMPRGDAAGAELQLKKQDVGAVEKPKKMQLQPKAAPEKPKKIQLKPKAAPNKPKKAAPEPRKAKRIKPANQPKKLAKPGSGQLRKLPAAPGAGKTPKPAKRAAIKQPGTPNPSLRKDLVNPPARPVAKGLKPTAKIPETADTNPLKAGATAGVLDTGGNGLRIAPGAGLKKDLAAPNVKDLAVRPQIRESLGESLKEDLAGRLEGGSAVGSNLQGLGGGKGSTLGERAGVRGRLGDKSRVSRTLRDSLTGYNGPDPGGRRSRVLDGGDKRFELCIGDQCAAYSKAEALFVVGSAEDPDNVTDDEVADLLLSAAGDKDAEVASFAEGTGTFMVFRPAEVTIEEEAHTAEEETAGDNDSQASDGEDDGQQGSASSDQDGSDDWDDDWSDSDTTSGNDDDGDTADDSDQGTDTADQGCPEGDEDCGEAGGSEGGGERTVEGGPENPSSCEEGADCSNVNPDDESGDGTVRTAGRQEDERGGPLKGDGDTSPANGTLRLANEEEVGGELVRGGDALQRAGNGTLRLPEGEDDDRGGTPQVAGGTGGGPVGDPGVVTGNVQSAGQFDNQEIQVNTKELNVDAQALEGVSQQATQ